MEKVKKSRSIQRSMFTRQYNLLIDFLKENKLQEARACFSSLEQYSTQIRSMDEEVMGFMLDDENITEENMTQEAGQCDEYLSKFNLARVKVLDAIEPRPRSPRSNYSDDHLEPTNASVASSRSSSVKAHYNVRLPKIELTKFSGEIKDWLAFWNQFQRLNDDETIPTIDKFYYLRQSIVTGSRAWRVIDSFPTTEANYSLALEALKERFGREDILIDVYIRELLGLALPSSKASSLSELYDKLECKLRALEVLGVTQGKCAAILCPLLESCMNEEFLRVWQRTEVGEKSAEKRLQNFMSFMKSEVQNEERISVAVSGFSPPSLQNKDYKSGKTRLDVRSRPSEKKMATIPTNHLPTAAGLLTVGLNDKQQYKQKSGCIFCCDERHSSSDCYKARNLSYSERVDLTKKHKCCLICLKTNHFANKCRSKIKCPVCDEKHVMLLCPKYKRSVDAENVSGSQSSNPAEENSLANLTSDKVLLPTLLVKVHGPNAEKTVRAVLDTGSQRSYVLKNLAEEMNYKPVAEESIVHALFGGDKTGICNHKKFKIHLSSVDKANEYKCNFDVLDQVSICDELPSLDQTLIRQLGLDTELNTDLVLKNSGKIEMLIGADVGGKLLTGKVKSLNFGLTAMETKLGWVLMGKIPFQKPSISNAMIVTSMLVDDLKISDLWKLDLLGISDPSETKTKIQVQEEVDTFFQQTLTVNSEGRYEVRLPWKESHDSLPTNHELALKRVENTIVKLKKEGLYEAYDQVFNEWEREGIIEQVPCVELEIRKPNLVHYLPHKHVVKENSTTKLRPVFDASAHVSKFPSLNDCLEKGGNLIEQIPPLFIKFRLNEIGVVADIKQAFLQISVHPEDRNSLRFLWKSPIDENYKTYRHKRVVFGIVCSPYHLGAVLEHHLSAAKARCLEGDRKYSLETVDTLLSSFYVDNLITSVENQEKLQTFRSESINLLADGKFDLRKWESNSDAHLSHENCQTDVLGMIWDRKDDVLLINNDRFQKAPDKITKRTILSYSHSVFDPMGFSCPVVLEPKLILRELWSCKSDWDDEVSDIMRDRFSSWVCEMKYLSELKIPRWFLSESSQPRKYSVHTFCDASANAYAAVIFLRVETCQRVTIQLVQAKARVAPVKHITIPRLELLAALIGARLYQSVIEHLPKVCNSYFWSDSSTVLAWIKRDQQWATFVRNRVVEIRSITNAEEWNHVPGCRNPADLPSRGCTAKQLVQSQWWEGPAWLKHQEDEWVKEDESYDEKEISQERVKGVTSMTCKNVVEEDCSRFYEYFSSYEKNVRMMAWILRFTKNCRGTKTKGALSISEIEEAEVVLLKSVQNECFTGKESNINSLHPFEDEHGLLRLKSKILNRPDNEDFRYPILLPKGHVVVERLIMEYHVKKGHVGTQILLAMLRERFWVMGGRRTVRSVITRCIHCKRHNTKALKVSSAPLPVERVRDASAFEVIGVDLAGPVFIKPNKKAWICLFTCGVFRAVHLELLLSLSTECFIQALRRFIARRGRPKFIFSDNGTNFTGTENALNEIDWNKVCEYCTVERIHWKLNPPAAPWWGGFFERLIGIMKNILRRVLKRSSLDYTEMETVLCDCESFINSRPLTYMSDDENELAAITPSMFIQDLREVGVPDLDLIEANNYERRYQYRVKVKEDLRKRFRLEYLGQLKMSSENQSCTIKVGDIVLIGNDKSKRVDWTLAKVLDTLPGKDGTVRLVKVKTSNGTVLLRHVHRLYPMLEDNISRCLKENEAESMSEMKIEEKPSLIEVQTQKEEENEVRKTNRGRVIRMPGRFQDGIQ